MAHQYQLGGVAEQVHMSPDHSNAWNIKNRFNKSGKKGYFLFLERNGIPPTNNASEQAIRFVIIDRRVTQGTRILTGMCFCKRAWIIVATPVIEMIETFIDFSSMPSKPPAILICHIQPQYPKKRERLRYFFTFFCWCFNASATSPTNIGCGFSGRDVSSG